jgi:tetratricopeptide (TPR) repeat protein
MNAAMKIFSLIALAVAIFLTGCATVKRAPILASEVHLIETKYGIVQIQENIKGLHPIPVFGTLDTSTTLSSTKDSRIPISALIENSQYIGQVHWSGTISELNIPESAYSEGISRPLAFLPTRVQTAIKERAAEMGANLVIVEIGGGDYQWVMEDGKFQPKFLLWGKAYWKSATNGAITDSNIDIEFKPDHNDYIRRGLAKGAKGDLEGAIADFDEAIKLKPDDILAYNNRSVAKRMKGDLEGAIADYSKVIELIPDNVSAYDNRGRLKLNMGDWDDAIADFNEAIKLKPDFDSAYGDRALGKAAKGDLKGAMADYNKAIDINPTNSWAHHRRGCLYYDSHDFTNAMVDFQRSSELEQPLHNFSFFRIWLIRARSGEAEAATGELREYWNFRKIGTGDDWQSKISNFLTGQLNEADLFNAARAGEQHCAAYFYAGSKRLIEGDKATATDYFEKCLSTDEKTLCEYDSAAAELKFLKTTN